MKKETPQERYDREKTVRLSLKLNKITDRDILEYLESTGNKQGAVKAALREKMHSEKEKDKNEK